MGNCTTCCGKADTNELVTEKLNYHQKLKGVSSEAPGGAGAHDHTIGMAGKKGYGKWFLTQYLKAFWMQVLSF